MKKFIIYAVLFVLICFVIPIAFTKKNQVRETAEIANVNQVENIEEKQEQYNYKQYGTIKLLHAQTEKVEELPIDEYLYGVVSSEMPASFEKEALKAQAVVARTYTIHKIQNNGSKHENADICDDPRLLSSMDFKRR